MGAAAPRRTIDCGRDSHRLATDRCRKNLRQNLQIAPRRRGEEVQRMLHMIVDKHRKEDASSNKWQSGMLKDAAGRVYSVIAHCLRALRRERTSQVIGPNEMACSAM
eukprot:2262186-Pleurochrysis_carterae.AAC.2